jgi:deferrochelatase/peroxidase EfeB
MNGAKPQPSRRTFLAAAGLLAAAGSADVFSAPTPNAPAVPDAIEPFRGRHQGGILTPAQSHTYFAAFDLAATKRKDVIGTLRDWTSAAARLSAGQTDDAPGSDSGEASGLSPARLTITFGFGPGLFLKNGQDRYGLAARRPEALVDLPKFNGDQLVDANTGGDISVQACADDPQVAFHAVRQLARLADGAAKVRWAQTGFLPGTPAGQTPRNLMGFKDGTNNPSIRDPGAMDKFVWVGSDGPQWMRGGSYVVVRRIRIALEHWDRMTLEFQEQTIGRKKNSGSPLGGAGEFDPPDLNAADKDGNPIIADNAHIRLAAAAGNQGVQILRRPYSYNDGVNFTSERWPPWRQGIEYDAGLLFVAYQRDPRTAFIRMFDKMSKLDMLNQFTTHTGGGLFACPGGIADGEYIGQRLFD